MSASVIAATRIMSEIRLLTGPLADMPESARMTLNRHGSLMRRAFAREGCDPVHSSFAF
jgi:hypothetical protein